MQEMPNILEADPRQDEGEWHGAVLLSDEIEYYCTQDPPLIDPFDQNHLRAARYNLTLGRRARLGGVDVTIDEDKPLTIPPHQVAILSTHEKVNIPRFLIARWALRVSSVYEGLLWVGALQVDPGWRGELYAPVYNMAEHHAVLYFGQEIFAMDFVKTTQFKSGTSKATPPGRHALEEFDVHQLRSAPRELVDKLDRLETRLDRLERRGEDLEARSATFLVIIVAVLGAIIMSLSIVVVGPLVKPGGELLGGWPLAALTASLASLVLSFAALVMGARGRRP